MPIESISGRGVGPLVHKFGANLDVDSGTVPEDIWDGPTPLYAFPAAVGAATIVSSAAADTGAGAGIQTVRVQGVLPAPTYLPFTEDVTLNGLGPVALATQPWRVNRMFGLTVGATGSNAGIIDLSMGGAVVSRIDGPATVTPGRGQTLQAIYTIPGPYLVSVFNSWWCSTTRQGVTALEVVLQTMEPGAPWRIRQIQGLNSQGSTYMRFPFLEGGETDAGVGPPGTDVRVTCTFCSANNSQVNGGFTVELL